LFNIVLEVLLRYVNAHAAELGVVLSADAATGAVPEPLRLLALAYADDAVLICPDVQSAQQALNLVQEWAAAFGMTIGVGAGRRRRCLSVLRR
jgi:hypothetical protein